jgi:hypothetical protein
VTVYRFWGVIYNSNTGTPPGTLCPTNPPQVYLYANAHDPNTQQVATCDAILQFCLPWTVDCHIIGATQYCTSAGTGTVPPCGGTVTVDMVDGGSAPFFGITCPDGGTPDPLGPVTIS